MTLETTASHPGIRPDSRLSAADATDYESSGQWFAETLSGQVSVAAVKSPDVVAVVQYSPDLTHRDALTYAELDAVVDRYAAGLLKQGVGAGDSVVVMLPNSIDFAALIFAINRIGAVYTGIPVAYGQYEVAHIVATMRPKLIVCQAEFGSSRPIDVVRSSVGEVQAKVFVRGDPGWLNEGEYPLESLPSDENVEFPVVDPRAVCHVGFTSGTTGAPKGVLNTNQTLLAVLANWLEYFGRENLGEHVVNAILSPVGHHSGFLWGVVFTARLQGTAVFLDRWSPTRGATVIRDENATVYFGAPTFLQDLLTTDLVGDPRCELRAAIITGSPVPRSLPAQGRDAFGAWVGAAFGMTEWGISISTRPGMSAEEMASDGRAVDGAQARIVGGDGSVVASGVTGRLQIKGAPLFLGYLGLPEKTAEEIDADGWFDTGDNARMDESGLVYLDGRSKDIIIRGGENIPVVAVESVLYTHPHLVDVAVVGVPDERLGERACAVIVHDGQREAPSLDELTGYLLDNGVSKHFLPERLVVLDELPKTASGKIRKVALREMAKGAS